MPEMTWTTVADAGGGTARAVSQTERVLAVGRAFLTVTALIAIFLDPTEPARLREATYGVLLAYAVYSLCVLGFVHRVARVARVHALVLHGLDILWTSALTFVSEGPVSPFFLFFLFLLLAAAYRWGFRETAGTAAITVAVFLGETALALAGPWRGSWFAAIDVELNRTILRVTYLMMTGVLLGYLAQQEKETRGEIAVLAMAARQPNVQVGLGGAVEALARLLLSTFGARAVIVVVRDEEGRRATLWRMDGGDTPSELRRQRLSLDEEADWFAPDPGVAWFIAASTHPGEPASAWVTQPDAWKLRLAAVHLPAPVRAARREEAMAVVNFGLAREWSARAYLVGVRAGTSRPRRLHFLEALADHLTPAMTNVFLLRRLRARASSAERARVARELHDGAIQALFGIEMKLEAIRRESQVSAPAVDRELAGVQELVRGEVLSLRELMQALRPIELDSSEQLHDVVATLVERFRRDTGISSRFVAGEGRVSMRPDRALEVVRVVQEALVNVRKHSRAANVLVRLVPSVRACTLVIEDDGCGLGFDGRLTGAELDAGRIGPMIIKERVRQLGGELAIESAPGAGTRIEVTFEQDG